MSVILLIASLMLHHKLLSPNFLNDEGSASYWKKKGQEPKM